MVNSAALAGFRVSGSPAERVPDSAGKPFPPHTAFEGQLAFPLTFLAVCTPHIVKTIRSVRRYDGLMLRTLKTDTDS